MMVVMQVVEGMGRVPSAGILSTDCDTNPYWCGANHLYQWYCSNDCYLADMPGTALKVSGGFYQTGQVRRAPYTKLPAGICQIGKSFDT